MDNDKRKQQAAFVTAMLAALGPDDRFQLAAADVGTTWLAAEPLAANEQSIEKALTFLNDRISLGWTNLDRAIDDVLKKSPEHAQVIYIGDGIVSAGDTDPAGFVRRLEKRVKSQPESSRRTLHAVAVGNSHEMVALRGIARVGGGSIRTIQGEQTPASVASELLIELTQPSLRDVQVEFRGVKVAALYPESLANVPAGTQHILVGRYLPTGKDQTGEVVVTGRRGDEKVRYAATIRFHDAEEGNSFIPRLWARGHLDLLLSQGNSETIRSEIICWCWNPIAIANDLASRVVSRCAMANGSLPRAAITRTTNCSRRK
jgi:hypothetical protein